MPQMAIKNSNTDCFFPSISVLFFFCRPKSASCLTTKIPYNFQLHTHIAKSQEGEQ